MITVSKATVAECLHGMFFLEFTSTLWSEGKNIPYFWKKATLNNQPHGTRSSFRAAGLHLQSPIVPEKESSKER